MVYSSASTKHSLYFPDSAATTAPTKGCLSAHSRNQRHYIFSRKLQEDFLLVMKDIHSLCISVMMVRDPPRQGCSQPTQQWRMKSPQAVAEATPSPPPPREKKTQFPTGHKARDGILEPRRCRRGHGHHAGGQGQGRHRSSLRKPQGRRGCLCVSVRSRVPARLHSPVALLITDGVGTALCKKSVTSQGTRGTQPHLGESLQPFWR